MIKSLITFFLLVSSLCCFPQVEENKNVKRKSVAVLPPVISYAILKKPVVSSISGESVISVIAPKLHVVSIAENGRLELRSEGEKGSVFYPAELAGYRDIRFKGNPSLTTRWGNNLEIAAVTTDGRIARIAQNNGWHIYFPAEDAGHPGIRCKSSPSITAQTHSSKRIMSVMAISDDDRLIEFLFEETTGKTRMRYPAEIAGRSDEKILPVIVQTPNGKVSQDVVLITKQGKLLHLWNDEGNNGDAWHGEFPAELAGMESIRFTDAAEIVKHNNAGQTIAGITTDGELVVLSYTPDKNWVSEFPGKKAGKPDMRFLGSPALLIPSEFLSSLKLTIFALNKDKKLVQLYQDDHFNWKIDYPASLSGNNNITFTESPAVDLIRKKTVVCKTNTSKYAVISDNGDRWKFEYIFN